MNVKLKVLSAAILAGFVGSAGAATGKSVTSPSLGLLMSAPKPANLTPAERGAYAGFEAALQAVEGRIYLHGCTSQKMQISGVIGANGNGSVSLAGTASFINFKVARVPTPASEAFLGNKFRVAGSGTVANGFTPVRVNGYSATADYDKAGGVMTLIANMSVLSGNGTFDPLRGVVIKDFYLHLKDPHKDLQVCASDSRCEKSERPVVVDWGLQSLAKKGYTQAKYWQWSRSTRSDGDIGETHMIKKRIYNANGNGFCTIEIHTEGFNDFDGFDQQGYLRVHADDKRL
jgi:hypothetical protein